jgi:hypothetical protein
MISSFYSFAILVQKAEEKGREGTDIKISFHVFSTTQSKNRPQMKSFGDYIFG